MRLFADAPLHARTPHKKQQPPTTQLNILSAAAAKQYFPSTHPSIACTQQERYDDH
jgi:hypothetical protein